MIKVNFDKAEIPIKLRTALLGTKFCGLCLENNVDLYSLETEVIIAWGGETHSVRNILKNILIMNYYKVCSQYICLACKESAVRSYVFIRRTKENLNIYGHYLEQLQKKVNDLTTNYAIDSIVLPNVLFTLEYHKSPEPTTSILRAQLNKPLINAECKIERTRVVPQKSFKIARLPRVENYICDCCTQIFPDKNSLLLHTNKSRSLLKNPRVQLCSRMYQKVNGVMKCPFCVRNPCRHKKYLISYQQQKKVKKEIIDCPDCSYTCKAYRTLIEHVNKEHLKMQYYCTLCKLGFYTRYKYLQHKKDCDISHTKFDCSYCKLKCANMKNLKQHHFVCDAIKNLLGNKSPSQETLNDPESVVTDKDTKMLKTDPIATCPTYPCGLCSRVFTNVKTLHIHKFRKHNCRTDRDYMCSVCQVKCISPRSLHEHLSTHSLDEKHKCLTCSLEFDSRAQYVRHTYSRPHRYKTIPSWLYDINTVTKKLICKICEVKFDSPKLYCEHMSEEHPLEKIWCDACSLQFEPGVLFLRHLRSRDHKARATPLAEENVQNLLNVTCSVCQMKFYNPKACLIHMLKQHPNAKHKCDKCNLEFDDKTNYMEHVKTVHLQQIEMEIQINEIQMNKILEYQTNKTNEHVLKCNVCDYLTENIYDLKAHKATHSSKKICHCKICGKRFTNVKLMNCHMKRHAGRPRRERYEKICYVCGKVLCNSSALKKHLRIHSGERPYQCDLCGMSFIGATECKLHKLKIHVGKSISCPLCHRKFYVVTHMRSHIKKDHWKSKEKFDYRKLEGLTEADYHLFVDRRKVVTVLNKS